MQDKTLSTQELIAQDVGARLPQGPMAQAIAGLALLWSLFQLWIASPLPFVFGVGVFNDTETRSITWPSPCCWPSWPTRRSSARRATGCRCWTSPSAWWPLPALRICSSSTSSWRCAPAA